MVMPTPEVIGLAVSMAFVNTNWTSMLLICEICAICAICGFGSSLQNLTHVKIVNDAGWNCSYISHPRGLPHQACLLSDTRPQAPCARLPNSDQPPAPF